MLAAALCLSMILGFVLGYGVRASISHHHRVQALRRRAF
jgi:hypothetical protein